MFVVRIHGTLDPSQLWPHGDADADTLRVTVRLEQEGFEIKRPGRDFKRTRMFDGASVVGEEGAMRPIVDKDGHLRVRLEGVDAPELHHEPRSILRDLPARRSDRKPGVRYRTPAQRARFLELNERYRQPFAETAAFRLGELLRTLGRPPLRCRVEKEAESLGQVFDCYGRMVGRLMVGRVCINDWLLERGLAVPAIYSSCPNRRIRALLGIAAEARVRRRGIWGSEGFTRRIIVNVSRERVYRPPGGAPEFAAMNDRGRFTLPLLFRHLVNWSTNRKAGMVEASFPAYLAGHEHEVAGRTADFLRLGDEVPWATLNGSIIGGTIFARPEDLVIRARRATLVAAGGVLAYR